MAHLYKRGSKFWISYYLSGKLVQKSLKTKNERVALTKKKRIEYELALGDLHVASKTPLPAILEAFCKELMATRTFKSYKNDFSRLRVFFGPVCDLLEPGIPGAKFGTRNARTGPDKYAGKHVKAELLGDSDTLVSALELQHLDTEVVRLCLKCGCEFDRPQQRFWDACETKESTG